MFVSGTYILGPSHQVRIQPNANSLGLPSPVILDGDRSKFTAKYDDELVKNDTIDNGGRVVGTRIPGGISGSIEVEKSSDDFNELMMLLDAAYFAGAPKVDFTMTETITLADSTIVSNQFVGTVFHGYEKGSWERKNIVKPSVQFFATLVQGV